MAVVGVSNFSSLLDSLKVEDPWLPPSTWESIPSESGSRSSHSAYDSSSSFKPHYQNSSVSESSLVRLALNALAGVESSLISIQKLSTSFCSDPADRTFHQIPSIWNRSLSTHALGRMLNSIGFSGCMVFLLHRFVDYFTKLDLNVSSPTQQHQNAESKEHERHCNGELQEESYHPCSLVNQAFAIAVRKVLEGYTCALDTLSASVGLRRSSSTAGVPMDTSSFTGCLTRVVNPETTLLELYLHTKNLRTQIEALGSICNMHKLAVCFLSSSFEEVNANATVEFLNFSRGGNLLTYLYTLLQVADPAHCSLLKFLFLRACEPYCEFIRSWIFKAEINDPYKEFIVEYIEKPPPYSSGVHENSMDFSFASIRERNGVVVPCFLNDFLVPIVRAGQQLQVLMKLLEFCFYEAPGAHMHEDLLPCWKQFLDNEFCVSPMIFSQKGLEARVIARNNYYRNMLGKIDNICTMLEFRYHQVTQQHGSLILSDNAGENVNDAVSFNLDDRSTDDSDMFSVEADFVDTLGSSECSSLNDSAELTDTQQLIVQPDHFAGHQRHYSSPLSFFISSPVDLTLEESLKSDDLHHVEKDLHEKRARTGASGLNSNQKETFFSPISTVEAGERCWSTKSEKLCMNNLKYNSSTLCDPLTNSFSLDGYRRDDLSLRQYGTPLLEGKMNVETITKENLKIANGTLAVEDIFTGNEAVNGINICSSSTLKCMTLNNSSDPLSMNPILSISKWFQQTVGHRERCGIDYGQTSSWFDFSSVEDPFTAYDKKLACSTRHKIGSKPLSFSKSKSHVEVCNCGDKSLTYTYTPPVYSSVKADNVDEVVVTTNASGGSNWEHLLGRFIDAEVGSAEDDKQSLSATFEIPLDVIVDKCLRQEILLQYGYISKLTIKLLEEGFGLQEHFLALRRYHFMESADWADLFIMSLWRHKWLVNEADQRVSEIQGFLELSIQKSSCEQDRSKNRLFAYMKGNNTMPLSALATGLHSFGFLGLGYRVDWPVSIVLTPSALNIYADIFSFLIQVKLAVFSLNEVWCSLKDLRLLIGHNHDSAKHSREIDQFNKLVTMRHQVNHFVSTLQQYVLSHLSHVSWGRFLHSLKHKVKDMMDIESVHMTYLTDSLHICFLSDETQSAARNITHILQCAVDLRYCLGGSIHEADSGVEDLHSRINLSQVVSIKQKFEKNLRELHLCQLKSLKHRLFGLSQFWGYLNYNQYYSHLENEITLVL